MTEKARRATTNIAGIEVEVFQLPNGEYVMSQAQAAGVIDAAKSTMTKFIQRNNESYRSFQKQASNTLNPYTVRVIEITKIATVNDSLGRGGNNNPINIIPINLATDFWLDQTTKGNVKAKALVSACVQETLKRRCDNAFGVTKTEQEYEQQTAETRRWEEARQYLRESHITFMLACSRYKFNAALAHDVITISVCGKTAAQLRELDVIEGDDDIGLNHIYDIEAMTRIAKVKVLFGKYRKGGIGERVVKAKREIAKKAESITQ